MPTECKFIFARSQPVFFTGELVHGKIAISTTKLKNVSAILLQIEGHGKTSWSPDSDNQYVGGPEYYIKTNKYLLSSKTSDAMTIPLGTTTYAFTFQMPKQCPSSFESKYGHIRYKFKVVLVRPWKFNQNFTKGFTVMKMLNLNHEGPLVRSNMRATVKKDFTVCLCRARPLSLHVDLPQGGYVPGQHIPATILVNNHSTVSVQAVKVKLIMIVVYRDDSKHKMEKTTTLSKYTSGPIRRQTDELLRYNLMIPPTPPTCQNSSKYIDISYMVKVETIAAGMHSNPDIVKFPIVIGSVPLMPLNEPNSRRQSQHMLTDNVCAESPPPPWEEDESIPPPTYEESMHIPSCLIKEDELNDYGELEFCPKYATFKVPSPESPSDEDIFDRFGSVRSKTKRK